MRYLATALVTEGRTDDRFLRPLLGRALEDLCAQDFDEVVDVSEVRVLRAHGGPPSVEDILKIIDAEQGSCTLAFVHRDRGPNPERVDKEWLAPLRARWGARREHLVMVVPIREMEAWLLADGAALRSALRVRWADVDMGIPAVPDQVEQIPDPKATLSRLGARMSRSFEAYYERVAEEIAIDRLKRVPAFQQWWRETAAALVAAGFRPYDRQRPGR